MNDILLSADGDLHIGADGDICLTTSIRQAIQIRLRWFLGEWRFSPETGFPYYEEILRKSYSPMNIRSRLRETIMEVEGVEGVKDITINVSSASRAAVISATIYTVEGSFREEVIFSE